MKLRDVVIAAEKALGTASALANELDVSPQTVGRLYDNEIVDKVLAVAGFEIVQIGQDTKIKNALKVMSELFIEADNKN